jgi:hypothetical protein
VSRKPGRRYFPTGPVTVRTDFWHYGPIPDGYDVYIEVRDLYSERDRWMFPDGYHKVVVEGPQPRPRSKAFHGETAWSDANRYAGDVVAALQKAERERDDRDARSFLNDHISIVHVTDI